MASKRPIADIAVSSACDTGIITVHLSGGGIQADGDLDYEQADTLRSMLADAMGHIGAAPHSGDPQMTCAQAEDLAVNMRAETVEQFTAALLTGLDDLERVHHWATHVEVADVAGLVHRVALEVGRG